MKPEEYGEKYKDHLLEQYKLYVTMADNVSARRAQTNAFYISVLSGLLAVLALAAEKVPGDAQYFAYLAVAVLGILLCIVWMVNLESYRQLNSGKFKTIHEIEQQLPFPCYQREWELMRMTQPGEKPRYRRLTHVEKWTPGIVLIPYLLLLAYAIINLVK